MRRWTSILAASKGMNAAEQVGVDRNVEADRFRRLLPALAGLARLADGLVDHLAVELEADRGDVARLLLAEQVAGAADVEVAHRDLEARAELGVVGEGREARRRILGQRLRRGVEQVGEGALARAADPAADLVGLGEAELVGALDDQGVGAGDVESRLDDRRRHQAVGVAAQEAEHRLLELGLVHLPVGF